MPGSQCSPGSGMESSSLGDVGPRVMSPALRTNPLTAEHSHLALINTLSKVGCMHVRAILSFWADDYYIIIIDYYLGRKKC